MILKARKIRFKLGGRKVRPFFHRQLMGIYATPNSKVLTLIRLDPIRECHAFARRATDTDCDPLRRAWRWKYWGAK
jgi:hypothetical protein